ncbi:MAG: D-alanine--D-alanine ligase [candidate division NC10 bacterium]|nr:D-alanine--D-alanine ligase [candidate division NC10 bacterium]
MPRRQRILALVYEQLVPPENAGEAEAATAEWKTEYDVVSTLRALGHEVLPLGVGGDLGPTRKALEEFKPHIVFNLLEAFDQVPSWDHNVVAFLELMKVPYTGCNSRGLLLARDKALAKKLLSYHRIPVTDFAVFPMRRRVRRPRRLAFPLIVKSLTLDSSIGISQASVVETEEKLEERVRFIHESIGTDALVETYVEGRELYVGILGNQRLQVLPIWELLFTKMPEEQRKIATERLKWTLSYQRKRGIVSAEAADLPEGAAARIRDICKRVYRSLMLSGCARIDLRLSDTQGVYVMEAKAKAAGLEYADLLQRIVTLGLRWEPTLPG